MAQKDDVGTVITVTVTEGGVAKDISSATEKLFFFRDPNGDEVQKTAQWVTDGSDGQLKYTTIANDLDVAGTWWIQAKITTPSATFRTEIGTFEVGENIEVSA